MPTDQHLVEVLFAMWFDPSLNPWDSTYYGIFYEKIQTIGYTEKQEQKQVKIRVDVPKNETDLSHDEPRMVFRNPNEDTAIILSKHFISFHKLAPYHSWERLFEVVVNPGLKVYNSLGLGKGIVEVQSLYLNKYELGNSEKASSVFKFLPTLDDGIESSINFQGRYDLPEGKTIQLKLNGNIPQQGKRDLFFECSCFVKSSSASESYSNLAEIAHDEANKVFRKIVI